MAAIRSSSGRSTSSASISLARPCAISRSPSSSRARFSGRSEDRERTHGAGRFGGLTHWGCRCRLGHDDGLARQRSGPADDDHGEHRDDRRRRPPERDGPQRLPVRVHGNPWIIAERRPCPCRRRVLSDAGRRGSAARLVTPRAASPACSTCGRPFRAPTPEARRPRHVETQNTGRQVKNIAANRPWSTRHAIATCVRSVGGSRQPR